MAFLIIPGAIFNAAYSQKTGMLISGRVTSAEESIPLEGVTVLVKGTQNITGTMADGSFTLSVKQDDTVVVELSGYESKNLVISKETYYEIPLKLAKSNSNINLAVPTEESSLVKPKADIFPGNSFAVFFN